MASPLTMSGTKKNKKNNVLLAKVASPFNLRPVSILGRASQVTTAKPAAPWSTERISWPFRRGNTTFLWGRAAKDGSKLSLSSSNSSKSGRIPSRSALMAELMAHREGRATEGWQGQRGTHEWPMAGMK